MEEGANVEPASWSFLDTALQMYRTQSVIRVEITEGTSQLNSEAVC